MPATAETAASAVMRVIAGGALPTLDASAGAGPDANGNGVRDDIDALIRAKWGGYSTKAKAATQAATALQRATAGWIGAAASAPLANTSEAVSQAIDDAVVCLSSRFGNEAGSVLKQLEQATTNTKERFVAYRAYNASRSGTSRALANTDPALKCR